MTQFILAIDSSSRYCSVALSADKKILVNLESDGEIKHNEVILGLINQALQQADITLSAVSAVAYARGPGSFMGLRIACGVTQAICLSHKIPCIGISTLDALAFCALEHSKSAHILTLLDARMQQVYWALHLIEGGQAKAISSEKVSSPAQLKIPPAIVSLHACGSGCNYPLPLAVKEKCVQLNGKLRANALHIARLAWNKLQSQEFDELALPVYVRDQVANLPAR